MWDKATKIQVMLVLFAIIAITFLETVALLKGQDGVLLSLSIALIALLAPSPAFKIQLPSITIEKKSSPSSGKEG